MRLNLLTYHSNGSRVLWHAVFWIVLVLYHSLIYGTYSENFARELMWEAVALPTKIGATYLTLYVLLPRFFMSRRFVRFALWLTVAVFLAAFFQRIIEFIVVREFSNPYERADVLLHPVKVLRAVIGIYPVVVLAAFIKLGKSWLQRDLESENLERVRLESELKFLKTQIQPHFLFNTLNNLYALTLKKSEKASEVVLKLSDMISYMLYDGSGSIAPLAKEIEAIETYLELEKLRYGDRLDATFDVTGDIKGCAIPPMLLLPFVENAFKHGISRLLNQGEIRIELSVKGLDFRLMVKNSVDRKEGTPAMESSDLCPPEPVSASPKSPKDEQIPSDSAGTHQKRERIGLANVRRRLELLYGDDFRLEIHRGKNTFTVDLRLKLENYANSEIREADLLHHRR